MKKDQKLSKSTPSFRCSVSCAPEIKIKGFLWLILFSNKPPHHVSNKNCGLLKEKLRTNKQTDRRKPSVLLSRLQSDKAIQVYFADSKFVKYIYSSLILLLSPGFEGKL